MDWGRLFFSPTGRIRRQEFWISFLLLFAVSMLVGWIVPIWPVVLYCSICTRAKRLHDMNRTGWLQVIPAIGYTLAATMTVWFVVAAVFAGHTLDSIDDGMAVASIVFSAFAVGVSWFIAVLVDFAFLLWIGCAEGDAVENRFGSEPYTYSDTHIARA